MRILHVVQCLGMGGQERLILNLSRELERRGHRVAALSLTPGGDLAPEFGSIRIFEAHRVDGFNVRVMATIARAIRQFRPHAIHTHNPSPMVYAVPPARLLGVKRAVHTKHGANIYGPRSIYAARAVTQMLSAFVAVSKETAEVARTKERVPERILHTIPNGIPLNEFAPNVEARARIREELGIPPDAFVIGTVGRLAEEKDYALLVRAASPLLSEKTRLVIVGEGLDRPNIEKAIAPSVAAYVHLTGARRDVANILAAFDVFALTSKTEGLPLVIPEAMASGLSIVSTAVGGIPGIVPAEVGTLVPKGDEAGLTRAFEAARSAREKTKQMGEAARAYALSRFSLERMADAYEALYR